MLKEENLKIILIVSKSVQPVAVTSELIHFLSSVSILLFKLRYGQSNLKKDFRSVSSIYLVTRFCFCARADDCSIKRIACKDTKLEDPMLLSDKIETSNMTFDVYPWRLLCHYTFSVTVSKVGRSRSQQLTM